jgi:hypothetical protein
MEWHMLMEIMNIELECQYDKSCIKIVNNGLKLQGMA